MALVVEVADASPLRDRTDKARLYARARIPQYWIVNVVALCVEVHLRPDPEGPSYLERAVLTAEDSLTLRLPGSSATLTIPVAELLP